MTISDFIGSILYYQRDGLGEAELFIIKDLCKQFNIKVPENIVKRLDPFQADKEMCDKCQVGYGYDYMIFKKHHHHAKGGVDNV